MLREFFAHCSDLIVPPRRTERIVRSLSYAELHALAAPYDGILPYADERVHALVWELKYYDNERAAALGGTLLADRLLALVEDELGVPTLVPTPMYADRRRERGYSQTERLCEAALRVLGEDFVYRPHELTLTRAVPHQQGLARAERLTNIAHSMAVPNPTSVAGHLCIVIDDVQTTGATLKEATRALYAAGARKVIPVALAH